VSQKYARLGKGRVRAHLSKTLIYEKITGFQRERSKARTFVSNIDLAEEEDEDVEEDRASSGRAFTLGSGNRRNFREPPSTRSRNRNNPTEAPRSS